jgi:hypothetical protein
MQSDVQKCKKSKTQSVKVQEDEERETKLFYTKKIGFVGRSRWNVAPPT